jgi:hypothetical protein
MNNAFPDYHAHGIPRECRGHEGAQADRHEDPGTRGSSELQHIEGGERSPDASERRGFTHSALREAENHWEEHNHPEEKHHPRSVFPLAQPAEETERVRRRSDGQQRRRGPPKKQGDRMRQERANPAEVSSYSRASADDSRIGQRGECAAQENREEEKDNPANLAGKSGARGLIAPVPVRAW